MFNLYKAVNGDGSTFKLVLAPSAEIALTTAKKEREFLCPDTELKNMGVLEVERDFEPIFDRVALVRVLGRGTPNFEIIPLEGEDILVGEEESKGIAIETPGVASAIIRRGMIFGPAGVVYDNDAWTAYIGGGPGIPLTDD